MYNKDDLAEIRDGKERWADETLDPVLERHGERQDRFATVSKFATVSNLEVDRLYTPDDVADIDHDEDVGFPGEEPYTRGVYPTMYRGRTWTMRQFAGFGTAEETNERSVPFRRDKTTERASAVEDDERNHESARTGFPVRTRDPAALNLLDLLSVRV